ncbi:MAG: phage holin family protein [Myxococcales bacterium]|nr:phage holin family protein [Myxococcales bacterium]
MLERPKATEGNISSALARLIEASHNLIMDRIDLLRVDTQERVEQFVQIIAVFVVAALVVVAGWFGLLTSLVLLLDDVVPRWATIGFFSIAHLLFGAFLVKRGVHLSRTAPPATKTTNVPTEHEGAQSGQ